MVKIYKKLHIYPMSKLKSKAQSIIIRKFDMTNQISIAKNLNNIHGGKYNIRT